MSLQDELMWDFVMIRKDVIMFHLIVDFGTEWIEFVVAVEWVVFAVAVEYVLQLDRCILSTQSALAQFSLFRNLSMKHPIGMTPGEWQKSQLGQEATRWTKKETLGMKPPGAPLRKDIQKLAATEQKKSRQIPPLSTWTMKANKQNEDNQQTSSDEEDSDEEEDNG